jgi:hypothetical protein
VVGLRSGHGGDDFEMLFADGDFVLQLHRLDAHEAGLTSNTDKPKGIGVSLWFEIGDQAALESLIDRARGLGASILEAPHWNPLAHHHEATLLDPDGYVLVINTTFEPGT